MNASREMPRYQCHKQVWALKIREIAHNPNPDATGQSAASSYGAVIQPADEGYAPFDVDAAYVNKHNPQPGGYYVVYEDGYTSYSPAKAFEDGYSPMSHAGGLTAAMVAALSAADVDRRYRALSLATTANGVNNAQDAVDAARKFDDFLRGAPAAEA